MNKYKVIAICGKSAAGKDTFLQEILKQDNNLHEIVSCTTRPPREHEVDGKSYHFLTLDDFDNMVHNGELLECCVFRNWVYGTALKSLDPEKTNIGVFNPDGIRKLIDDDRIDLFIVLIQASNKVRLIRSLNRERDPDVDEIVRRYLTDLADFDDFIEIYKPNYIFDTDGAGWVDREVAAREVVLQSRRHWAKEAN